METVYAFLTLILCITTTVAFITIWLNSFTKFRSKHTRIIEIVKGDDTKEYILQSRFYFLPFIYRYVDFSKNDKLSTAKYSQKLYLDSINSRKIKSKTIIKNDD